MLQSTRISSKNVKTFTGSTSTLYSFLTSRSVTQLCDLQSSIAKELKYKTVLYTKDIEERYKRSRKRKRSAAPAASARPYIDALVKGERRFMLHLDGAIQRMAIYLAADIPWFAASAVPLSVFKAYVEDLMNRSDKALVVHGDMVGIIAAQSCSERFTQTTLNAFHLAGTKKSAVVGIKRIEEILSGVKTLNMPFIGPITTKYNPKRLLEKYMTDYAGDSGIAYMPGSVTKKYNPFLPFFKLNDPCDWDTVIKGCAALHHYGTDMFFDDGVVYFKVLSKPTVTSELTLHGHTVGDPVSEGNISVTSCDLNDVKAVYHRIAKCHVSGLVNCIDFDDEDHMLIFAPKTPLKAKGKHFIDRGVILDMCPDTDLLELWSNDIYYIESTYGISAAQTFIQNELTRVLGEEGINLNTRHISLIAANMTVTGSIMPNTFFGLNISNSVIRKATFRESTNIFANAAANMMRDDLNDVSAQITVGALARIGTYMTDYIPTAAQTPVSVLLSETPPSTPMTASPEYAEMPLTPTSSADRQHVYCPASPEYTDPFFLPEPDVDL
jgi:hypothetical protein